MTVIEIEKLSKEIDKLVELEMPLVEDEEEIKPIFDGIICPEKYIQSKYKILWILKEPYDDAKEGGWDFKDMIRERNSISSFSTGRSTFKPIIYSSWGILNNFCLYDDMGNVEDLPEMLDAFKSIAYINVKKTPGGTTSNYKIIESAYIKHKSLLLKQLNYINADIIIGGKTLSYFLKDLNLNHEKGIKYNNITYYLDKNKLFIDTHHPAQWQISQEQYCNNIINVVKIWSKNKI